MLALHLVGCSCRGAEDDSDASAVARMSHADDQGTHQLLAELRQLALRDWAAHSKRE